MSSNSQGGTDGAAHPVAAREGKPSIALTATARVNNDRGADMSLVSVAPIDRDTTQKPMRDDQPEFGPGAYHEAPLSEKAHCWIVRKRRGCLKCLVQPRTRGQGDHPKNNGHPGRRRLIANRLATG